LKSSKLFYLCMKKNFSMIQKNRILILFAFAVIASLYACEKEITVDLPAAVPKIVVEGNIEQGQAPLVLISKSSSFFAPTDLNSIQNLYRSDAVVTLSNGTIEEELIAICSADIPEELLPLVTEITGFTAEQLSQVNICAYTSFNPQMRGELDKSYTLKVELDADVATAVTKINKLVPLDSLWFRVSGNTDSLGFLYAVISDPDTLGNAYRWFAKRINSYPEWSDDAGEQKDQGFIAPLGSVSDDVFFNGLSFEFGFFRGTAPNSGKEDDVNDERGFYKIGDTVVVKGCVIDRGVFRFVSSFEDQVASSGSPFASPANVFTNVEGGLGLWAGYGAVYDTVICQP